MKKIKRTALYLSCYNIVKNCDNCPLRKSTRCLTINKWTYKDCAEKLMKFYYNKTKRK